MSERTLYERVGALNLLDNSSTETPENPAVLPLTNTHSWQAQPRNDLKCGESYRGRKISFCPWNIVTHYHEWFVGKKKGELIGPYFDAAALLQCKLWDFYYVWHPANAKKDCYAIVVPTDQFEDLISRINETLDIQLSIPAGVHSVKFRVIFGEFGTPLPRFLGHALDPVAFSSMVSSMPPSNPRDVIHNMPRITAQAQTSYLRKVDGLFENHDKAQRKKNKSEKSLQRSIYQRRSWGKQAKRVQRYMGLRHKLGKDVSDVPKALDYGKPTSCLPEGGVMFVAMDIESYEFNRRMVTEIGFGILDVNDVVGVAPGEQGKNWLSLVRGRHLRIREHAHAINRVHVQGYENNFNFGTSEFVKLNDVPQLLREILQPHTPTGEPRQVVLVGHGISSDLEFVKHVGFNIARDAKFLEIVDTQDMHRHLRMLPQQVGLARVLSDLDIESSFLHNGGNDAVYTLQAMISLSVLQRDASLRRHHERLQPSFEPDPSVAEGGWDTNGEMSDGGYPGNEPEWKDEAPAPVPVYEAKVKQPKPVVKISDEEAEARWGAQEPVDWPLLSSQQAGSSSEGVEGEEDLIWL